MERQAAIKQNVRQKIADELTHLLADTYLIYVKTQNFHWNVTGPNFSALHKLFEQQYQELAEATDEIAERIRALDCFAPGSFSEFQKLSSLKEDSSGSIPSKKMLEKLVHDHETIVQHIETIFVKVQKGGDEATLDLLNRRTLAHDKMIWMLRSSL